MKTHSLPYRRGKCDQESATSQFYDHSCPKAQQIVKSIVAKAVAKETRPVLPWSATSQFYDHSCPKAQQIVKSIVAKAVAKETRRVLPWLLNRGASLSGSNNNIPAPNNTGNLYSAPLRVR
ncbi:hypothetical protein Patl1_22204 [Pistacia atlantica]|uniref:Uncharacterized protein n=1 Tax=Pistacia atlantica TaxID=434234 RepID=A0ACC1BHP4_9ROSI|nr:hypothetical protein Patl1_22204 [Pistacia atlantica]